MGTTNEYERDLNDQVGLKRPGRIDLIVFNNTEDAGDGHPGIQKCFRNYLHEGGIEKDLDLQGYGIIGNSVDINNAELQQLSNIGSATISSTQWGYLGVLDQNLRTTDTPIFNGVSLTGNLVLAGNSITGTSVDINNAELQQLSNIGSSTISGTQWGYLGVLNQNLRTTDSPTFNSPTVSGLTVNGTIAVTGNITITGTVDGVDVGSHTHSGAGQGGTVSHNDLSNRDGSSSYLHSTSAEQSNWNSAYSHISSTGTSHTYINQSLKTTNSPTFAGLTINGSITVTGNVDGVDVAALKTDVDGFPNELKNLVTAEIQQLENIGSSSISAAEWGYVASMQSVSTTSSPTFGGLTLGSSDYFTFTSGLYLKETISTQYWVFTYQTGDTDQLLIYQSSASTSDERGNLGITGSGTTAPLERIYSHEIFTDDGTVGSYSHVDDLQLLREVKVWDVRQKALVKEFPDEKQNVFDKETLPWIRANKHVNELKKDNNNKRYMTSFNSKIGYLLSTMQEILLRQDKISEIQTDMIKRLKKLENS